MFLKLTLYNIQCLFGMAALSVTRWNLVLKCFWQFTAQTSQPCLFLSPRISPSLHLWDTSLWKLLCYAASDRPTSTAQTQPPFHQHRRTVCVCVWPHNMTHNEHIRDPWSPRDKLPMLAHSTAWTLYCMPTVLQSAQVGHLRQNKIMWFLVKSCDVAPAELPGISINSLLRM